MLWTLEDAFGHLLDDYDDPLVPSRALLYAAREAADWLDDADAVLLQAPDAEVYDVDVGAWSAAAKLVGEPRDREQRAQAARHALTIELVGLGRLLDDLPAQLAYTIALARTSGLSWGEVGRALGVSQQAAHKRHSKAVDELLALQHAEDIRDWADRSRQRRRRR